MVLKFLEHRCSPLTIHIQIFTLSHLIVQQTVLVAMRSLVSLHLLSGHSSKFLGQFPPPGRHLHRRGQQDEIQDQSGNQTLAVHLQQCLTERQSTVE